jgi:hypothetical protein
MNAVPGGLPSSLKLPNSTRCRRHRLFMSTDDSVPKSGPAGWDPRLTGARLPGVLRLKSRSQVRFRVRCGPDHRAPETGDSEVRSQKEERGSATAACAAAARSASSSAATGNSSRRARSSPLLAAQIELADALIRMVRFISWGIPNHSSPCARADRRMSSWYGDPIIAACYGASRTLKTPWPSTAPKTIPKICWIMLKFASA